MSNDQTDVIREQGEQQRDQQVQSASIQQATNPERLADARNPSFVETLGDPDISTDGDEDDDLEEMVKSELSRTTMLAAIDEEERERQQILTQNRAEQIKAELIPRTGPGSKCRGEVRRIMTGETNRPTSTPEMERRIDAAVGEEGARQKMLSMAEGGKGLDAVSKIQSVTEAVTPSSRSSDSGGGYVSKAKEFLFG